MLSGKIAAARLSAALATSSNVHADQRGALVSCSVDTRIGCRHDRGVDFVRADLMNQHANAALNLRVVAQLLQELSGARGAVWAFSPH